LKTRPILVALLTCLVMLSTAALPVSAQVAIPQKPVVVVHAKGMLKPDAQLTAIMSNVTEVQWVVVTGELTAQDLTQASMLILVQVDSMANFTGAELNATGEWFAKGGKAIWTVADSDYGTDRFRIFSGNEVLKKIGSVLRFEDCESVDPVSNAGADYRVLGVSENCDPEMRFLVAGVTRALFHGPGLVVGYSGGKYVKLEKTKLPNVFVIMTTSKNGTAAELTAPAPEIHEIGETGTFPLMVLELDSNKKNVIIATAEAPFDQYEGMYMPELRNYKRYGVDFPQQGKKLFENIISYVLNYASTMMTQQALITSLKGQVTTLEGRVSTLQGQVTTLQGNVANLEGQVNSLKGSLSMWQGIAVATLVVGLVIGAAVVFFMKRK